MERVPAAAIGGFGTARIVGVVGAVSGEPSSRRDTGAASGARAGLRAARDVNPGSGSPLKSSWLPTSSTSTGRSSRHWYRARRRAPSSTARWKPGFSAHRGGPAADGAGLATTLVRNRCLDSATARAPGGEAAVSDTSSRDWITAQVPRGESLEVASTAVTSFGRAARGAELDGGVLEWLTSLLLTSTWKRAFGRGLNQRRASLRRHHLPVDCSNRPSGGHTATNRH